MHASMHSVRTCKLPWCARCAPLQCEGLVTGGAGPRGPSTVVCTLGNSCRSTANCNLHECMYSYVRQQFISRLAYSIHNGHDSRGTYY